MTALPGTPPAPVPVYKALLEEAKAVLHGFAGRTLEQVTVARPTDTHRAVLLANIVSKLSPFVGNTVEYETVFTLNQRPRLAAGAWARQDPGFPDVIYEGDVTPVPGVEMKAWFPLATEITGRFKDSVSRFADESIDVAIIAWLPEHVIYGRPRIIDVWVDTAKSLAESRDRHYHRPPDYLVIEPRDTRGRTRNLRQSNTAGFKFQGTAEERAQAEQVVAGWGENARTPSCAPEYQARLAELMGRFPYRNDTNYAKSDRVDHPSLEAFKTRVLDTVVNARPIREWARIIGRLDRPANLRVLEELLGLPVNGGNAQGAR